MRTKVLLSASLGLVASLFAQRASAQQATGWALSPYNPSEKGSAWFAADSLDFRKGDRVAAGFILDYAAKPLSFKMNGKPVTEPVKSMTLVHVGLSYTAKERVRIGLSVPVVAGGSGDGYPTGGDRAKNGDVRVGADVRLFGDYGSLVGAIGVQAFVPVGDKDKAKASMVSDGKVRLWPKISFAKSGPVELAFAAGPLIRKVDDAIANNPMTKDTFKGGTTFAFAAAAGVKVANDKLLIGPELYGQTDTKGGGSPIELIGSLRYWLSPSVRVGAGAGGGVSPGKNKGYGQAAPRVLATFEWSQPADTLVRTDRDGDGVWDDDDACPDQKGVKTDDPKTNGCPPREKDRDGDGVLDADDACPDQKGVKTDDPKTNGCPKPKDSDGDGILDVDDACPDEKGVASSDPKKNGCPVKDTDGDGILDPEDACPDQPGPKNADPKKNGCPAVRIEAGQVKILEQVKFKTGSAVILAESNDILSGVAKVLKEHPEIKKVRVEGHTDNKGSPAANKQLSKARAESVKKWLMTKGGVEAARLTTAGFGQEKPIDTNDTDAGRQNNRRVEFHIE